MATEPDVIPATATVTPLPNTEILPSAAPIVAASPNSYSVGDATNMISIEIQVSTVGIVKTIVAKDEFSPSSVLVKSKTPTGIIPPKNIGTGDTLESSTLIIMATINLAIVDESALSQAQQNIIFTVELTGGISTNFIFNATPNDLQISDSGTNIVIMKQIELV